MMEILVMFAVGVAVGMNAMVGVNNKFKLHLLEFGWVKLNWKEAEKLTESRLDRRRKYKAVLRLENEE